MRGWSPFKQEAGPPHATAPGAVVRKRKANRAEQDSSSDFLISKRPRQPNLGPLSINGASLGREVDQEGCLEMLADRVLLIEQISRMNEEMRVNPN